MTSFISTYENKVDKRAEYRSRLLIALHSKNEQYQGIIAYPSLTGPSIEGFGRDVLEELNRRRFDHSIENGDFSAALVGGSSDGLVETIMSLSSEMPFG